MPDRPRWQLVGGGYWHAPLIECSVFGLAVDRVGGDTTIVGPGSYPSGNDPANELRFGLCIGLAVMGVLISGPSLQRGVLGGQGRLGAQAVAEGELLVPAALAGLHEV